MPKYNNPRRTWKYSNDFKVNAVQLSFVVGVTIKSVAETLDIHPFMLVVQRYFRNAASLPPSVVVSLPLLDLHALTQYLLPCCFTLLFVYLINS